MRRRPGAGRRGFSLLEVMVALAILTVSLVILVETQSTAAHATREAERFLIATDLAEAMLAEAVMRVEMDGFTDNEVFERGDFDSLGDRALDLEIGSELKDYRWEYAIQEIDIALAGDIASMAGQAMGGEGGAGLGEMLGGGMPDAGGMAGAAGGLGALLSPDMLSQMLGPYIREVRVRVWWGKNSKQAEDDGTEVVVITHVINPGGELTNIGQGMVQ